MKKLFGAIVLLLFLVGAYLFVKSWKGTAPWGVGTGSLAHRAGTSPETTSEAKTSLIRRISDNPQQYSGKRVTVSGRVRGNVKYASNRNTYRLTDGQYSLLVVDDKATPKEYWPRTVSGTVKVVKPPLGKGYAYIVSVKGNPNINLKWQDVAGFFTEKYQEVKKEVAH
jgi:hypothetical protein